MNDARPNDWHLVGEQSDPFPWSSLRIDVEASYYSGVADDIEAQIGRLRQLTDPHERLKGRYADGLQGACEDLADHLEKMKGRFETTGSQLDTLGEAAFDARVATGGAVRRAEGAWDEMTQDERDQQPGPGQFSANPTIDQAHRDVESAKTTYHDTAVKVASAIRDAADDDMKDSFWDKVKGAVGSIASQLDWIADVLGWIATALVLVSLFIPGLNLVVLALALTVLALGIHTLLAVTGNGSWLDVAMDVLALVTFRMGGAALKGAQAARQAGLRSAASSASRAASTQAFERGLLNGGRGFFGGLHSVGRLLNPAAWVRSFRAGSAAASPYLNRALPNTTVLQRLAAGGDDAVAALAREHRLLLSSSDELLRAVVTPELSQNLSRALLNARIGFFADLGGKLVNPEFGPTSRGRFPRGRVWRTV